MDPVRADVLMLEVRHRWEVRTDPLRSFMRLRDAAGMNCISMNCISMSGRLQTEYIIIS